MDKIEQLVAATIISLMAATVGVFIWGFIYTLATHSLRDILTTVGASAVALGVIGLVYLAIGRWWSDI